MHSVRFILVLVLLVVIRLDANATTAASRIEEGRPFPDLTLPALEDGRPLSVADFRGRKIVLHVFASW